MRKSRDGFGLIGAILILAVVGVIAVAAVRVYQSNQNGNGINLAGSGIKVGNYTLKLIGDAQPPGMSSIRYKINIEADETGAAAGNKKITAELTEASNQRIKIALNAKEEKWVPDCGPNGFCGPPSPKTQVELPQNILNSNDSFSAELIISADGSDHVYSLEKKDFVLSVKDNGSKVSAIGFYPDGVGRAYASREPGNYKASLSCDNLSTDQITQRLNGSTFSLANTKYPGIENIQPKEVLVIKNNGNVQKNEIISPADNKGCVVTLWPPDTTNF